MRQQVDITLKLSLWLDAEMDEDEIVTHVRASLPKAFGEELTVMDNPVDIIEVKQEAEIYSEVVPQRGGTIQRLLDALTACARLLADHDESEGEEGDAYREAMAAIAEETGGKPMESKPIFIEVRGGVVVDVQNVPSGYKYEIKDYDDLEAATEASGRAA